MQHVLKQQSGRIMQLGKKQKLLDFPSTAFVQVALTPFCFLTKMSQTFGLKQKLLKKTISCISMCLFYLNINSKAKLFTQYNKGTSCLLLKKKMRFLHYITWNSRRFNKLSNYKIHKNWSDSFENTSFTKCEFLCTGSHMLGVTPQPACYRLFMPDSGNYWSVDLSGQMHVYCIHKDIPLKQTNKNMPSHLG